tara:strand:- start:508 stop:1035 length:528 start_codon:yes stop_codon:yes gene_type:complete
MSNHVKTSKLLSYLLRHNPGKKGLVLDSNGFTNVAILLEKINITIDVLNYIVTNDSKGRYEFNKDHTMIRATNGHSTNLVSMELKAIKPPALLYHGTYIKAINSIKKTGLSKMNRHYVHLTEDITMATNTGKRRGKPIVLKIKAIEMYLAKFKFYKTSNNVWYVDNIPHEYIVFE